MKQTTPSSYRKHIVLLGRRNVGKSSVINAITGQDIAIVSEVAGTTTDPVQKAMEISPLGPVVLIDTAGLDDVGELGEKRVRRTHRALYKADISVLVVSAEYGWGDVEEKAVELLRKLEIPFVVAVNKVDVASPDKVVKRLKEIGVPFVEVSALKKTGIDELKKLIAKHTPSDEGPPLISDLADAGDVVVLVIPIDLGAPKGRLITPQVQVIRELIDIEALAFVVKERELRWAIQSLKVKPKLVVTDSQAVMRVVGDVPPDVPMTTFSILEARHRGDLVQFVSGLGVLNKLKAGDPVLVAEACTHHPLPDDIGRVKIPRWLTSTIGVDLDFHFHAGVEFPENIHEYKLIIHCGGCMLTRKAVMNRLKEAKRLGVPVVNYGVLISYLHGALKRALEPFPLAQMTAEELGLL